MANVLVLGGTGFLGGWLVPTLSAGPYCVTAMGSADGNLLDRVATESLIERAVAAGTDTILHLAYPGSKLGIETSLTTPYSLAADVLRMDQHVIDACVHHKVRRLICMGSACAYPQFTTRPTDETELWDGYPEPINAAYGIAKRTQLMLLQAARQQFGLKGVHVILGNLYGPGDRSGHVIPSLIMRVRRALRDDGEVVVWGHPEVTRSFLYVQDAADGLVRVLQAYSSADPLNLMSAEEISMRALVAGIAAHLGYHGDIRWDGTKPTGHTRRVFDITRATKSLHWTPPTSFAAGLAATIDWHLQHVPVKED